MRRPNENGTLPGDCHISNASASEHRILFADDEVLVRDLVAAALELDGFSVKTVDDGEQAWEELHRTSFDLLITDNEMPRLTGLRLVQLVRQQGLKLPIIMASGAFSSNSMESVPGLQITAVVAKPFKITDILHAVHQVLLPAT